MLAQVIIGKKDVLIVAASCLCMCSRALGFDPVQVDLTLKTEAEESSQIDHLRPVQRPYHPAPEFRYLAQYWAQISDEEYHYVVVLRRDSNGRCYVQQGDVPKTNLRGRPYRFKSQAEISTNTAQLIYEYWVNMLLQTRYDSKRLPYMPPATVYTFSTLVAGIGWLHGYTASGVSPDMPPYWMGQAGEALFEFVTKSHNETELVTRIKEDRDKFYDYMKAHPCH
jgi:hypothetical protein